MYIQMQKFPMQIPTPNKNKLILCKKDKNRVFSIGEILFLTDKNGNQVWVVGAVDNITKDFRVDIAFRRNEVVLKTFITNYIEKGNKLITDGWNGYSFIDEMNGYSREVHIHGASDFGFGINSTSHIESIQSQLKATIKQIYYIFIILSLMKISFYI